MTFQENYTPHNKIDDSKIINNIFNNIQVLQYACTKNRQRHFQCKCLRCDIIFDKELSAILHGKNIGCPQCFNKKHLMSKHRIYEIYKHMKQRCCNKKAQAYKRYGAVGITICDDWFSNPQNFIDWALQSGYKEGLTLDRIDNTKGYSVENCRWVDMCCQNANKATQKRNTSGCAGVIFDKNKWQVQIKYKKQRIYLGRYINKSDAINVRNEYIINHNFPHPICNI